ncbi:MAG: shikimate dehydrogenase [Formosa sp.]|jgi:shikimate dehydrogenase|nr:shikimate dehydrogenase [Formosa sp.]MDB2426630.1 shikimate dehydrogenase [Flavobacteriaceae bacterium]MDC0462559.1 shikimate dehydrogenase [Flavobacteriaceae bacterium]|tara:strand:+ start:27326 stop:28057 length:732 start_codon:yes stop_codon:yes gene_type:complete
MKIFGLIGKNIDYSFSRSYFREKFETNKLDCSYKNFDLETIDSFIELKKNCKVFSGFNVTIPYKEVILPYLDYIDEEAKRIGAINTIKIKNNKLIGYNTDHYGFKESLVKYLKPHHKTALILGTGGASKAVAFALRELGIKFEYVSRTKSPEIKHTYNTLTSTEIEANKLIINCTPLGTFPKLEKCPEISYDQLDKYHLLFDLIYNPAQTKFLKNGKLRGAKTINGLEMLINQAEKSWEIWNS